jgi:TRAP-type C4-dicarboxylate transport system permease small subunit
MRLAAAARGLEDAIGRVCAGAAVALGLAIFVLMLLGIAGRHVFSRGLPAVTELPEQLFPWFVMASVVLAARAGAHVAVEFVALRAGPVWQRRLATLARSLTVALCSVVVWTVVRVAAIAGGDRSPILGIPTLHFHLALALGFGLVGVLAACALARGATEERP